MNILRGALVLCFFSVLTTCYAETLPFCVVSKPHRFTGIFLDQGFQTNASLDILQAALPQKIRAIDPRIRERPSEFSVTGYSAFGIMRPVIRMVEEEGACEADEEAGVSRKCFERRHKLMAMLFHPVSDPQQYIYPDRKGFLPGISSGEVTLKKALQLTRTSSHRNKRALMFVFFMDKAKADPGQTAFARADRHRRMHILGPKRVFTRPEVIDDIYPLDISVARYDEGYAPQELNLVVPSGRPREVRVSWLWSF